MMGKNDDQVYKEIYELGIRTWCEENPKIKDLTLSYNQEVSNEAKSINNEAIIIDACTFCLENYNWHLEESNVTGINCTVPGTKDSKGEAVNNIINYYGVINDSEKFMLVLTADDIEKAKKEKKVGVIIGSQSCEFMHHDDLYSSTKAFARLGLRIMQIAYNHRTFAADGCYTGTDAGITNDGIILIDAMEKEGIVLDLSHVGNRSTLEAMEVCKKPPIFSHANPNALFPHPRNISDEQAKKCAALGGVIGVSSYSVTLWNKKRFPDINNFIDAIEYYVNLVGIDHVGLGLDSNAQPGAYERKDQLYFINILRKLQGNDCLYYKSYEAGRGYLTMFTEGLLSMANMVNITEHLLKRGFLKNDILKILGKNWLRVFRQCWK